MSSFTLTFITGPILIMISLVTIASSVENEEVRNKININLGEVITGYVSSTNSWTLALNITNNTDKAIRYTVISNEANLSLPLFISIRQGRHISSLTLPYIEGGHSYSQVSRTLCPLLNTPLYSTTTTTTCTSNDVMIYIDISSPTHFNISFNISTLIVTDYKLRLNTPHNTTISSSSPIVHVYEYPVHVDRVLIKVTSLSLICALVSIQNDLCPVDQLLDTTDHRGNYQTMQQLAAINVQRPIHQNFVHIVITLYHHGNCSDTNYNFIDGLITFNRSANYDPVGIHDDDVLTKAVTIEIGHTLSSSEYAVAMIVLLLIMMSVVIGSCIFIIVDELCCYKYHSSKVFLINFKSLEPFEDVDKKKRNWLLWLLYFIVGTRWLHEVESLYMNGPQQQQQQQENFHQQNDIEMHQLEVVNIEEVNDNDEEEIDSEHSLLQRHNSYRMAMAHSHTTSGAYSPTTPVTHSGIAPGTHSGITPVTHSHTTPRTHSHNITIVPYPRCISDLEFPEGSEFQKKYSGYWAYLLVIVIFYSLPVYQLVLTYQRFLVVSGNGDFCYYNSLCSHPLIGLSAFNNIWSNIGFFSLGILFIIITFRRRLRYKFFEFINEYYDKKGEPEKKLGVPQYFGVYYAAGISLMGEAIMSGAYHVCPTGSNYQFDTTMMFVLVTLGLYQLFKCRNPDITTSPYKLLLILACLILFIGMGVLYTGLIFYIIFFCIFEFGVLYTSLQIYYRWRLEISHIVPRMKIILSYFSKCLSQLFPALSNRIHSWEMVTQIHTTSFRETVKIMFNSIGPPRDKVQFFYLLLSNITNFVSGVILLVSQPTDFATSFLAVMIINLMLSLIFHLLIKIPYHCYGCGSLRSLVKPILYLIISIAFWITGIIFYQRAVTDWLKSPAGSRNDNQECLILNFYDSHDLWHICSAFGIFFAFLLLMTLEDHVQFKKRTDIKIY